MSQVIIKLLAAKIIIKVLFLPVTPVTASVQTKIHWTNLSSHHLSNGERAPAPFVKKLLALLQVDASGATRRRCISH